MLLTPALAQKFARMALGHVTREYPSKLDHVMAEGADAQPPRALHPVFFGSFDWHSCVHSYWLLLRLRRRFPGAAWAADIERLGDAMLIEEKVAGELAYLARPESAGFERPYGWAWAMALTEEAAQGDARWAKVLAPLGEVFAARFTGYLARLPYPIRTGTHYNTAFALVLALAWCRRFAPEAALARRIRDVAVTFYYDDRDAPAWEPSGDDFLSGTLMEAVLMRAVLGEMRFRPWLRRFLPRIAAGEPRTLVEPARVTDRGDGKIAHLDGLNLSRAWCWRLLADIVAGADNWAAAHIEASLPHIDEEYMGSHWLATFAMLALDVEESRV